MLAWYITFLRKSRCSLNSLRVITQCQGQFKIRFQREPDTTQSTLYGPSPILSSHYELSDFVSNLHRLSYLNPSIFRVNDHFFGPLSPLHRLLGTFSINGLESFREPTNAVAILRLTCLIWILMIFLQYAQSPLNLALELQDLNIRLRRHGLDRFGSPMTLCWLLLREEESFKLHPRSWAVVRLINIIKMWEVSRQYNLTALLCGYLLYNQTTAAHQQLRYYIMEGIVKDLDSLTGEMIL
jgi:hypothetical protein